MSDYGLELINDYSYSIATMEDVNYALRSSGTIDNSWFTTMPDSSGGATSYSFLNLSEFNSPLIFFKSVTASQRLAVVPERNKRVNVLKWSNMDIGSLQYYIFDRWIPPERSDYGIQIFDANENIIFDGGWHFLKIRTVVWLDIGFPNHSGHLSGSNWSLIGNAGSGNLAIAMPLSRGYIYPSGVFGHFTQECVHLDSSGNIFCSLVDAGEFLDVTAAFGFVGNMKSQVMVSDVSNLPETYNPIPR